jgi:hypothetical protein
VKSKLNEGHKVVIFTARANNPAEGVIEAIEQWCEENIGTKLPVSCIKSHEIDVFYDDRARQVLTNRGIIGNPFAGWS